MGKAEGRREISCFQGDFACLTLMVEILVPGG